MAHAGSDDHLTIPQMDGGSDTRSQGGRSHHGGSRYGGSQAPGSRHQSVMGSQHGGPPAGAQGKQGPAGYPAPLGYDPARDKPAPGGDMPKNIDLPPEAYALDKPGFNPYAKRPGLGTEGRAIEVSLNQYRITRVPEQTIHQYDVHITPEPPKPGLINAIWRTRGVQDQLKGAARGSSFIFDGRKLAWSHAKLQSMQIVVDMDVERGRQPRQEKPNKFAVLIKITGQIELYPLRAYLEGTAGWNNKLLEIMNFFDHVLRQYPSENMLAIRRNFYNTGGNARGFGLSDVIEAYKGTYASIRMNSSIKDGGKGLGINVDVANTTFWKPMGFRDLVEKYLRSEKDEWRKFAGPQQFENALRPVEMARDGQRAFAQSEAFKALRRLAKLKFTVKHRGKTNDTKEYTVKGFAFDRNLYGPEGATARTVRFEAKMPDGSTQTMTVEEYFNKRYGIRLDYPRWPLIETTRAGKFPMELCMVKEMQQYHYKLSPNETSNMIKFAVTRPPQRLQGISQSVQGLRWNTDPYLREFGIEVNGNMPSVKARVIQNPEVQFAKGKANPGTRGRWDLRGQVFVKSNVRPLTNWGFVVMDRACDINTVRNFAAQFQKSYQGHGGVIKGQPSFQALMYSPSGDMGNELTKIVDKARGQASAPDLLFFVLSDKSSFKYERLKKNMDIRYATVSQMVQVQHVQKAQGQYCSNVAMKVNAKLGGQTARLPSAPGKSSGGFFKRPTMIIGADVSHAAPGSTMASMAAISVSMDKDAAIYAGACQTNGSRVELISTTNYCKMIGPLVERWIATNNIAPQDVFYFRDGVSEGQFAQVMEVEYAAIKRIFEKLGQPKPNITVIVATKRHHIRFFPKAGAGDNNGNPLPGTVVEREVTHPFHYDFYLCSHVAIQGTARPVHYHVVHDEIKYTPDELQKMIYHHCYQYMRSTTPVSLHPAVYYAHLISNRARAHESIDASERDPFYQKLQRSMPLAKADTEDADSRRREELARTPLLHFGAGNPSCPPQQVDFIKHTMWYI